MKKKKILKKERILINVEPCDSLLTCETAKQQWPEKLHGFPLKRRVVGPLLIMNLG